MSQGEFERDGGQGQFLRHKHNSKAGTCRGERPHISLSCSQCPSWLPEPTLLWLPPCEGMDVHTRVGFVCVGEQGTARGAGEPVANAREIPLLFLCLIP